MKIISLMAENVKRLKAVFITPDPDGNLIIVGGRNEQGKTSVLDAIEMLLGGMSSAPPKPVREGQKKATIVAELGDLTVRRTIDHSGRSSLTVTCDGKKQKSPQTILDNLMGSLSFDPLAFARMGGRKQAEQLRELVGLDFTDMDTERAALVDERATANREVKRVEGSLKSLVQHKEVGAIVKVSDLVDEMDRMKEKDRDNTAVKAALDLCAKECDAAGVSIETAIQKVELYESKLKLAEEELKETRRHLSHTEDLAESQQTEWKELDAKVSALEWQTDSLKELSERLKTTEATNKQADRRIGENERHAETTAELKESKATHRKLDSELRRLDEKREALLAGAEFPVEGLGFDENGVALKGVPFEQASTAEALRVSLAMGLAINKDIKVILIRDGSALDDESMVTVAEMAAAEGAQVWMERVGTRDECAVIIEDGEVLEYDDNPNEGDTTGKE